MKWNDFVEIRTNASEKRAQYLHNAPIAQTGFDRLSDLAGRKIRPVAKRLLAEFLPFGTSIPAVRRQVEADFQDRFQQWFDALSPEKKERFYDL